MYACVCMCASGKPVQGIYTELVPMLAPIVVNFHYEMLFREEWLVVCSFLINLQQTCIP